MNKSIQKIALLLFVVYCVVLLNITLFRTSVTLFDIVFSKQNRYITSFESSYERANFIPFHSLHYYLLSGQEPSEVGLVNLAGNLLLYLPFGLLLPLTGRRFRKFRMTMAILILTSFLLETLQLVFALGQFDVDDILLNGTGGLIGYGLFRLLDNGKQGSGIRAS